MSKTVLVNKIIPFSNVDGEGNRTAIFLQGCNYNCLYCHNPETINICNNCGICVSYCEYDALSIDEGIVKYNRDNCVNCDSCISHCERNSSSKIVNMTVEDILKEIEKTKYFISGITVSGGECTLQSNFLVDLFKNVKAMGLTTFIDTNGSTLICENKELLEVTDKAMIDLKAYNNKENLMLTGQENDIVIRNIVELGALNKLYEIRTVVVPEVLQNEKTVDVGSKLLAKINPNIIYKLIKYRPLGVRKDLINATVPSQQYMEELREIATNNGCKNVIIV